jgi:hypothetical protein
MTVKLNENVNVASQVIEPTAIKPVDSRQRFVARIALGALNTFAAIAPVVGYLSNPASASPSEVAFDVLTHTVRTFTFFMRNPPRALLKLSSAIDGIRVSLLTKNALNGTSTFPMAIQAGDAFVHGTTLAGAYNLNLLY